MLDQTYNIASLLGQNYPIINPLSVPVKTPTARQMQEAYALLRPETDMEAAFMEDEEFQKGLFFGKPRFGHPEGEVVYHIREVLDNVDRLQIDANTRRDLRTITFVHDTFKHREDRSYPRDWSRHHGMLARHFLARFTKDEILLEITARHDDAYYAWRDITLYHKEERGKQRLNELQRVLGKENMQLFYLFFKCDTQTGDKVQIPVRWFEQIIPDIEMVTF